MKDPGNWFDRGHLVQDLAVFRSFMGLNGLALIRDVEDPEPPIEPGFPIAGIRPYKMNSSRLGGFGP